MRRYQCGPQMLMGGAGSALLGDPWEREWDCGSSAIKILHKICWISWLVNTWGARTSMPPLTNLALSVSSFGCFKINWWQQDFPGFCSQSSRLSDFTAMSQKPGDGQVVSAVGVVLWDGALSPGGLHWPQRASELSWNVGKQLVPENELLCKKHPWYQEWSGNRPELKQEGSSGTADSNPGLPRLLVQHLVLASWLWRDFGFPALLWAASPRCRPPPHSHGWSLMAFSGSAGSPQAGCLLSPSGATGPPRLTHRNPEIH